MVLTNPSLGAIPLTVDPANASRPSGAACPQAFVKTAAVVRRGPTSQTVSSSSLPATSTIIVAPDVGDGLISSIIFCSGVAIAFILVRRRLMRGSADNLAGSQNVGIGSRRGVGDLGSGIGGGSWPGSRERLPLRM